MANGRNNSDVRDKYVHVKSREKEVNAQHDAKDKKWPQVVQTLCIYCCFTSLGLSSGTLGPTLVHIEILYGTDTQGMSVAMMGVCIGYLLGSVFCGLVLDRFNRILQCAIGTLILGLSLMCAPQTKYIYVFYSCITVMAFCQGYIYSGGSPYIIELWSSSALKAPLMQGIHAIWGVGAFSCPFIAVPFLVDIPQWYYDTANVNRTHDVTDINEVTSHDTIHFTAINSTVSMEVNNRSRPTNLGLDDFEKVRFVYILAGGASVVTSLLFSVAFFATGPSLLRKQVEPKHNDETSRKRSDKHYNNQMANDYTFKYSFLFMMFLYCNVYYWYDYVPGNLLSAFVIKGLRWRADRGALITSMFWGSFTLGRALGVPASYFITPTAMLTLDILGATTGFLLLGIAAKNSTLLVWISVAIMGISTATTLPTAILWTSKYIPIDGKVGAMFLIASSTGGLSGAAVVGYLFQTYSHMWLVYMDFCACVTNILLFSVMFIIVKYFMRKYKLESNVKTMVVQIGNESKEADKCLNNVSSV